VAWTLAGKSASSSSRGEPRSHRSRPAAPGTFKGTTGYRDRGDPVEIQTPPADQVVDIWELMKKMGT
jgi:hypothetical protein